MAKSLQIGNYIFSSKKSAKDHIESILSSHDVDSVLSNHDMWFIQDLLAIHPDCEQMIGSGIEKIVVHHSALLGNKKHFYIQNKDGKMSIFNWKECLSNSNEKYAVFNVFRDAISYQVVQYKKVQFLSGMRLLCPYTHTTLDIKNAAVEHQPPFTFFALVNAFLKEQSLRLNDVKTKYMQYENNVFLINDKTFIEKWQQYHAQHSKLRLISIRGNLQPINAQAERNRQFEQELNAIML